MATTRPKERFAYVKNPSGLVIDIPERHVKETLARKGFEMVGWADDAQEEIEEMFEDVVLDDELDDDTEDTNLDLAEDVTDDDDDPSLLPIAGELDEEDIKILEEKEPPLLDNQPEPEKPKAKKVSKPKAKTPKAAKPTPQTPEN